MPYTMHRIFCAAPGDLGAELKAFYKVISEVNEKEAMPRGILLVSLALPPHTFDKRPFQHAVTQNVLSCRYYVQILEDTWGPPQMNFEREYTLALQSVKDPNLPMQEVAVLFKKPLLPHQVEPGVIELKERLDTSNGQAHWEFADLEEFQQKLRVQVSGWVQTMPV